MTIENRMRYRLAHRKYRLPFRTPLHTAHGVWSERDGILIRLEDEAGRTGYGEMAPIPWFGTETVEDAEAACRQLGETPDDADMDAVPEELGCVRFGLAAARVSSVSNVGHRLPVAAMLRAGRGALAELPRLIEAGYVAAKWKVAVGSADDEVGILDDLCAILPSYFRLRLDANGGWTRRQAGQWLARCAERPVEFVEQALRPDDRDGLLGLAGDYPVKLALDESVARLAEARRWQAEGWRGIFVIKPALAGPLAGIEEWAISTKADVVISSAIETPVGRAAILRWVLGAKVTDRALGFGIDGNFEDTMWNGPAIGPLADASAVDFNPEALWNALS